jgi:hypothetical protein
MCDCPASLEFVEILDTMHGFYLDARRAFGSLLHELNLMQTENLKRMAGKTIADLDKLGFVYEAADPEPGAYLLHECTQGEYKGRNSPAGDNPNRVGNMCITHIYSYWEDHYRARIAEFLGMTKKDDLKIDVFGDIRYLRNSIVHHAAIALPDVARCKVLKWFKPGDRIALSRDQFRTLITEATAALRHSKPLGS